VTSYSNVIKLLHNDVIYTKTVQLYATFAHVPIRQDGQCTYDLTFRRVPATIVAVEKR